MKIQLQSQLQQWKTKAARYLASTRGEREERQFELEHDAFEECLALANRLGTTVEAVVHEAIEMRLRLSRTPERSGPRTMVPVHPLLELDALTFRKLGSSEEEQL
jgi:hypothetical protein